MPCRAPSRTSSSSPSRPLFVFRTVGIFVALLLLGLVGAFLVTRNKRYLTIAWLMVQVMALFAVVLGLLYVFERVLLF
jgi:F0F1-type ATP synthase membrane subunit c/vacuolar-type H+-ATPase subunit K